MKEILTLQKGYKLVEKKDKVSPYLAYNTVLSTEKQCKYSKAEYYKEADVVILTRHLLICPNCGSYIPAYANYFTSHKPRKKINRNSAYEWCGTYSSLFDAENTNKQLDLYTPLTDYTSNLSCPACEYRTRISDSSEEIIFEIKRRKITLTSKINTLSEFLMLDWSYKENEVTSFPLYESITFNFKKHKVFLELYQEDGSRLCVRDITNGLPEKQCNSKLLKLINNNIFVKTSLLRYFKKIWNGIKIPFTKNEVNLKYFVYMTTYIGFNKDFYLNIPSYLENDTLFDTSFKREKKLLSKSDNLIQLLENSTLPKLKSIKKLLFENQHYFFYFSEIQQLFNLLGGDSNLLISFLQSPNGYIHLFLLHSQPGIMNFYSDFSKLKSPLALHKILMNYGYKTTEYALFYSSLNTTLRKQERKKWNEKKVKVVFDDTTKRCEQTETLFSEESKHHHPFELKEQTYNGFTFRLLKNRKQQIQLGQQLRNCLESTYYSTPIVAVIKNGHYVAAIEIDPEYKAINQAFLSDNEPIYEDKNIFKAFKTFAKKNKINYNEHITFYE